MRAQGASAVWQAVCDYDPTRGVPFSAYARQRVLASVLTRYRQEWAYAFRCVLKPPDDERPRKAHRQLVLSPVRESLREALTQLSSLELWLLAQVFWEERTEADIAQQVGISQQAVSKRKSAILRELRRRIDASSSSALARGRS
jgi:RNA polymerase sigma factor (sigma-70 family)